eukprot:GHUV01018639.1.p1 GENE.GHUV01018639.1~~GHUV01018639.1.p1  ORF type:complete len:240 (+),score=26.52 GHUV01018639.1:261-980(+)
MQSYMISIDQPVTRLFGKSHCLYTYAIRTLPHHVGRPPVASILTPPYIHLPQVTTRAFGTPFGPLMVPLIDMANHHNNCKHTLAARITCGPDMEDGCIVWKAGSDLRSGEEVCLTYHKKMLQDMAVLQYGFLQDDDFSKEMSSIDRHDYDADYFGRSSQPSTSNNTAQLAAEIDRLTALLAAMATFDATLRLGPDASRDQDGVMLRSLITWRQQRQGAIASELRQLSGMLQLAALNETA